MHHRTGLGEKNQMIQSDSGPPGAEPLPARERGAQTAALRLHLEPACRRRHTEDAAADGDA